MKQFYGQSASGDIREAAKGISGPQLLLLMSNEKQFEQHVEELQEMFPGVPSIGCVGMSYGAKAVESGVGISAFTGVKATANVIEEVSLRPVKYIRRMDEDIKKIEGDKKDTFCIDFCSGNDACVITTVNSVLGKRGISLVGGTTPGKISVNGKLYGDAMAYAAVKNTSGKVKVYKENIYRSKEGCRYIASKTDRGRYYLGELNGKPAKKVYMELTGASEKDIVTQTFKNPLGKIVGQDVCITSIKEVMGEGLVCYRQVNDSDIMTLLELKDVNQIVGETISHIRSDFSGVSGVFSINCAFRYILFNQNNMTDTYFKQMGELGTHCGLVGFGEHYNDQFINQTMACVAFE